MSQPSILTLAAEAVHGRGLQHGSIGTISRHTELLWNALDQILDEAPGGPLIRRAHLVVPLRQSLLKLARFAHAPRNRDNGVDAVGYWELADRMLQEALAGEVDDQDGNNSHYPPTQPSPAPVAFEAIPAPSPRAFGTRPVEALQELSRTIADHCRSTVVTWAIGQLREVNAARRVKGLIELQKQEAGLRALEDSLRLMAEGGPGDTLPGQDAQKLARDAAQEFRDEVRRLARKASHDVAGLQYSPLQLQDAQAEIGSPRTGSPLEVVRDFFAFPFPTAQEAAQQDQETAAVEEVRVEAQAPQLTTAAPAETKTLASEAQHQQILAFEAQHRSASEELALLMKGCAKTPGRPTVKIPLKDVTVERNPQWMPGNTFATQHLMVCGTSREWQATLRAPMQGIPVVGYGGTPVQALKDLQRAIQATQEFIEQSGEVEKAPVVPGGTYGPSTIKEPTSWQPPVWQPPVWQHPFVQPLSPQTIIGPGLRFPQGIPNTADMQPTTVSLAGQSAVSGTAGVDHPGAYQAFDNRPEAYGRIDVAADHASEGGTP